MFAISAWFLIEYSFWNISVIAITIPNTPSAAVYIINNTIDYPPLTKSSAAIYLQLSSQSAQTEIYGNIISNAIADTAVVYIECSGSGCMFHDNSVCDQRDILLELMLL